MGKSVSGTVDANDRKSAIMLLKTRGINVTALIEGTVSTAKKGKFSISLGANNSKIALNFLQKFLQLHAGGLPVGDAIRVMRMRLNNPQEKHLAETIHKDVCEGKTIATAMRGFPEIFTNNTVCMIEADAKASNSKGASLQASAKSQPISSHSGAEAEAEAQAAAPGSKIQNFGRSSYRASKSQPPCTSAS